jgi:hypothetical protein
MTNSPLTPTKTIHWKETLGNRYLQALHPMMLTDEGYKALRHIKQAGEGSRSSQKEWIEVVYDSEYVAVKLIKDWLQPLRIIEFNTFQKVISMCWKMYVQEYLKK